MRSAKKALIKKVRAQGIDSAKRVQLGGMGNGPGGVCEGCSRRVATADPGGTQEEREEKNGAEENGEEP